MDKIPIGDYLGYPLFVIDNSMRNYEESLAILDEGISARHAKLVDKLEKDQGVLELLGNTLYVRAKENVQDYMTVFMPNIVWRSSFLTFYFYFEHTLNDFIGAIREYYGYALKVNDLRDNGFTACKSYLQKVCLLDLSSLEGRIDYLVFCNKVRNCLVHNGGIVHQNGKLKLDDIKTFKDVSVSTSNELILNRDFCLRFLGQINFFFNELATCLSKQKQMDDPNGSSPMAG